MTLTNSLSRVFMGITIIVAALIIKSAPVRAAVPDCLVATESAGSDTGSLLAAINSYASNNNCTNQITFSNANTVNTMVVNAITYGTSEVPPAIHPINVSLQNGHASTPMTIKSDHHVTISAYPPSDGSNCLMYFHFGVYASTINLYLDEANGISLAVGSKTGVHALCGDEAEVDGNGKVKWRNQVLVCPTTDPASCKTVEETLASEGGGGGGETTVVGNTDPTLCEDTFKSDALFLSDTTSDGLYYAEDYSFISGDAMTFFSLNTPSKPAIVTGSSWSSDATRLLFTATAPNASSAQTSLLCLFDRSSSKISTLGSESLSTATYSSPLFVPNDSNAFVVAGTKIGSTSALMRGSVDKIASIAADAWKALGTYQYSVDHLRFSADGKQLVYRVTNGSATALETYLYRYDMSNDTLAVSSPWAYTLRDPVLDKDNNIYAINDSVGGTTMNSLFKFDSAGKYVTEVRYANLNNSTPYIQNILGLSSDGKHLYMTVKAHDPKNSTYAAEKQHLVAVALDWSAASELGTKDYADLYSRYGGALIPNTSYFIYPRCRMNSYSSIDKSTLVCDPSNAVYDLMLLDLAAPTSETKAFTFQNNTDYKSQPIGATVSIGVTANKAVASLIINNSALAYYTASANNASGDADGDDYTTDDGDCNDNDAAIHPAAKETCNGKDDNCNGKKDEDLTTNTYYQDSDKDGEGNPNATVSACSSPTGYVVSKTDCDDTNAKVNSKATESCDGVDNDCDGTIDDGLTSSGTYYQDSDGDTYGDPAKSTTACAKPAGYVTDKTDCDDTNTAIHPKAAEACNGVDDDCDGTVDTGLGDTYYEDSDGDTYGNASKSLKACTKPTGYVNDNTDCNDSSEAMHPGASELCNNIDDNCDGQKDEGLTSTTYYQDADGDTYGNKDQTTTACVTPSGYVTNNTDCDDTPVTGAGNHPDASELNDDIDNNCDGEIDEGCTGNEILCSGSDDPPTETGGSKYGGGCSLGAMD